MHVTIEKILLECIHWYTGKILDITCSVITCKMQKCNNAKMQQCNKKCPCVVATKLQHDVSFQHDYQVISRIIGLVTEFRIQCIKVIFNLDVIYDAHRQVAPQHFV